MYYFCDLFEKKQFPFLIAYHFKLFVFCSKNKQPANYITTFEDENLRSKLNEEDLKELRKNRLFEIKMSQIMKEFAIFLIFLFILYVVAFSNLSSSSFRYNQLFLNTFVHKQKGEHIGLNDVKLISIL
jgi:hypothetical protein